MVEWLCPLQRADPASQGRRKRALPLGRQQVGLGRPAAGQRRRSQGPRRAVGRVLRGDFGQNPCQRRQGELKRAKRWAPAVLKRQQKPETWTVFFFFFFPNRYSLTWWERSGRGKWRTAKRKTGRRRVKVWPRELERDVVFYSGKREQGSLLLYIYISQTFAFILCPYLTVTFSSWSAGVLIVRQVVVRRHSIHHL